MKIDAEESEGRTFRKKYPVSAFPTLFFIDGTGEVLHKVVGGQDVKGLISNGELALRKVDYSREYAKKYEEGDRDPEFLYEYVKSLNKSNKPSLKVSNEYLRTQKDMTTEFNLRFIHEAAVEADSRIFNMMIEQQTAIGKLVGLDALKQRIELACKNTVQKAVEYEFEDLLNEAKDKMRKNYPAKADAFAAKADMDFYNKMNNPEKYGKACADYVDHVAKGDAQKLDQLAKDMLNNFPDHADCLKLAEKFAKTAASKSKDYSHHLNYASIPHQKRQNQTGQKSRQPSTRPCQRKRRWCGKSRTAFHSKIGELNFMAPLFHGFMAPLLNSRGGGLTMEP